MTPISRFRSLLYLGNISLTLGLGHSRRPVAESAGAWVRPGMSVIFRAEVQPGRNASERTFRVAQLLPSGRVLLEGLSGEHVEEEFEPLL